MSTCKICAKNGKPNVEICFSDKIRSQYSQKMIPLETDGSTFHKHYELAKTANGNRKGSTSETEQAQTGSSTPMVVQQEDTALEALTLEFKTLLKHIIDHLKANK